MRNFFDLLAEQYERGMIDGIPDEAIEPDRKHIDFFAHGAGDLCGRCGKRVAHIGENFDNRRKLFFAHPVAPCLFDFRHQFAQGRFNALSAGALGNDGRLAMANVDAVPAGRYGKAALEYLGVWPSVSTRVAQAENVRMALTLVSRGEAPLGIVYKTDAASDPAVRIIGAFPAGSHPAIIYPMALLASSTNPDAQALVDYLKMPAASPFFEKQGFTVLK